MRRIEGIDESTAPRMGQVAIESLPLPTEDPVFAGLLREARELSDTTYVVALRIDPDDLGGVVNAIRDGVFAHAVVLPVSGPETGHAVPQVGPDEVFAHPNLVVDGSSGEGIGMSIKRMHKVEAAAAKFIPLARAEYRLEALRKILEIIGQPSVYDPQSETHLNAGQIEARLADLKVSYQSHYDDFVADVTGKKVEGPKTTKEGKRTRIMAPPVRFVDGAPGHVAQVPADVEAWYKNIKVDWGKVGLVATGALAVLAPACAAATPVAPTPIQFATPTESSPTVTTPPTAEAVTATTEATATTEPTATAEATATEAKSAEAVVAETVGLPEGDYHFETIKGIEHMLDAEGNLMAVKQWGGEWINLENMREKFLEYLKEQADDHKKFGDKTDGGSFYEDKFGGLGVTGFAAGTSTRYDGSIDLGEKGTVYPMELMPIYIVDSEGKLGIAWVGIGYHWQDGEGNWWWFDSDVQVVPSIPRQQVRDSDYKSKEKDVVYIYKPGDILNFAVRIPNRTGIAEGLKEMMSVFLDNVFPSNVGFGGYDELEKLEVVFPIDGLSAGRQGNLSQ